MIQIDVTSNVTFGRCPVGGYLRSERHPGVGTVTLTRLSTSPTARERHLRGWQRHPHAWSIGSAGQSDP